MTVDVFDAVSVKDNGGARVQGAVDDRDHHHGLRGETSELTSHDMFRVSQAGSRPCKRTSFLSQRCS
ncbi:MAG TPA: hypothetical protein VMF89_09450 [Polyangiales bacterium]|nr:hypothetical protein [Polyangiales bacterium]